ncbi:hypothetical protein SK128_000097, partial [Halocaridina rubra]
YRWLLRPSFPLLLCNENCVEGNSAEDDDMRVPKQPQFVLRKIFFSTIPEEERSENISISRRPQYRKKKANFGEGNSAEDDERTLRTSYLQEKVSRERIFFSTIPASSRGLQDKGLLERERFLLPLQATVRSTMNLKVWPSGRGNLRYAG